LINSRRRVGFPKADSGRASGHSVRKSGQYCRGGHNASSWKLFFSIHSTEHGSSMLNGASSFIFLADFKSYLAMTTWVSRDCNSLKAVVAYPQKNGANGEAMCWTKRFYHHVARSFVACETASRYHQYADALTTMSRTVLFCSGVINWRNDK
jgi:hypothetical protein